jgi:hypothetical protein
LIFSVFAGLAILCNFVMMLTWIPASLAFYQRYCHASCCCCLQHVSSNAADDPNQLDSCAVGRVICSVRSAVNRGTANFFERTLPTLIILKARFLWILVLGGLIICSSAAVFYYPGLRLPDQEHFQLFTSDHSFERYDLHFKQFFGFEKDVKRDVSMRMPLRFVWGVKPVDNGNALNPGDKGEMVPDPTFDVATSEAQRWMLGFCEELRRQRFYAPTNGPLLSNCFIETFKEWMERRCKDGLTGEDRAPCCQAARFPYTRSIFEKCLLQAVEHLYETPTQLWIPGVAGPKFNMTTNRVAAAVIEYDARQIFSFAHAEMEEFHREVRNYFMGKTVKIFFIFFAVFPPTNQKPSCSTFIHCFLV